MHMNYINTIWLRPKSIYPRLDDHIYKQEHPRGSIVEPQCLHQDGLNYLSYHRLKNPIIIAHVYDIF